MGTGLDGWVTRVAYTLLVLLAVCPIHIQVRPPDLSYATHWY